MKHRNSLSLSLTHKHTHNPAHKDAFVDYAEQTREDAYIILKKYKPFCMQPSEA